MEEYCYVINSKQERVNDEKMYYKSYSGKKCRYSII
jgi:hypothetical protein